MAKREVACIIIKADGSAEATLIDPDLEHLKAALDGGWLEPVNPMSPTFGSWIAYVDEEGKIKGLPYNHAATEILASIGWSGVLQGDSIVGPCILLGQDGPDETDVPPEVAGFVRRYYEAHGEVHEAE